MNKIGLILFPAFDWQISLTHPERIERLLYTKDQLLEEGLSDLPNIKFYNPSIATIKDINRAHFVIPNHKTLVTNSHYISAGSAIKALELVLSEKANKAFSITRPPGHHAMEVVLGDRGFCVINNTAVMVEYYKQKYPNKKVAIIDTDCHHGDGTENIFYDDPNVLFISVHQDGRTLYPGTGYLTEQGGPNAYGLNINIPLPPHTGDSGYLYVADEIIKPILADFKPDLIIQGAGQDNHYSDPLTNMNLSAEGYARLTESINADILILEGGYSIEGALPYLNLAIILSLAGYDYSNVIEPDFEPSKVHTSNQILNYIKDLKTKIHYNYFNRDKLRYKKYNNLTKIKESKNLYYDTSNIIEQQEITYHLCNTCFGIKQIKTTSSIGIKATALSIEHNTCSKCYNQVYKIYEESNDLTYLKDKVKDLYISRNGE